jgi:ABC-2 type transport system ATP-binding protein
VTGGDPALVIETHGLARSFDGVAAVSSLDLTVASGEMFCIVGPDGAGKSTTIRLLSGILVPTGGSATVLGFDLIDEPDEIRTRVGYLSQAFTLYADLTVDENIEFFATLHGVRDFAARRNELLDFTRLSPARDRLAGNLSGGMKKKLALACTLVHTPRIVFLDEPSTGVDPVSRGEFWSILSDILSQGITVVLTTPYLDEAERCDRIGLLHRGRFMTIGLPAEITASMPGAVFAIVTDRSRDAYRELRTRWSSRNVVLVGDSLRFWSARGRADAESAVGLLRERGHGRVEIRPVAPMLDDAFVALLSDSPDEGPPLPSSGRPDVHQGDGSLGRTGGGRPGRR